MDLIPKVVRHAQQMEANESLIKWAKTAADCTNSVSHLLQGKLSPFFKDDRYAEMLELLEHELHCTIADLEDESKKLYQEGFDYPMELVPKHESL